MGMKVTAKVFADQKLGRLRQYLQLVDRRIETAALIATDAASRAAIGKIRDDMRGAQLGRLGNALGQTSDMQRTGSVYRKAGGFSASGGVFIRSRSERTRGAVEAYTEGAAIRPRGRWLWIPTPEAGRVIGKRGNQRKMSPSAYIAAGSPLGPLVTITGPNGRPLLAVERVGVSQRGRARSLTKRGAPRKGDRARELVVLFIAIPSTSRAARVDPDAALRTEQARLPQHFEQAVRTTREA